MNTNIRRIISVAALAVALAAGYGLARVSTPPEEGHADHAEEERPGADHDDHAAEAGAEAGHDEHGDEEGEAEEGVVALTEEQIADSGIQVVAVGRGGGSETRLSGRVESAVGARAAVAASIGGRVERVLVAPGSSMQVGDALAVIVSGEAASLRASADAARAEAEAARLVYERDQSLVTQGIVARQELEASRARSLAADATSRAAAAQLTAVGSPDSSGRVQITSPVAGVVGNVAVTPGGVVAAGDIVANVSDPSQTELVFTAPPILASQVTPGMRIDVTSPQGNFEAKVVGVVADARETSGSALIRAQAASGVMPPSGSPVAGVIVTAQREGATTVPADAVQTVEGRSVVFVASEAGFRATPVLAGRRAGGNVEVLNGLVGDERIAGTNAFLLKAELAKGEAEHGH